MGKSKNWQDPKVFLRNFTTFIVNKFFSKMNIEDVVHMGNKFRVVPRSPKTELGKSLLKWKSCGFSWRETFLVLIFFEFRHNEGVTAGKPKFSPLRTAGASPMGGIEKSARPKRFVWVLAHLFVLYDGRSPEPHFGVIPKKPQIPRVPSAPWWVKWKIFKNKKFFYVK